MDNDWLDNFLDKSIPMWQKNPVMYCKEVLNFYPDDWQEKVLMDLADNPKVSVKSGQGVGKTGLEAVALLWFLTCYPGSRVVATAPTRQQLNDVLWSEIAKWLNNSPLLSMLLKWTKTYIYMIGYEKRWFAVARTATKPENMQGFHEDNMLFIVDEASGVADPIMEAILGTLTGVNNKLLMCGNPTRTTGTFYDSHTVDRGIFKCHTVSSLDSKRTSKENIQSLIRKYGENSNVVKVRVYGEFPDQEDDVFIPLSYIEGSTMTDISKETEEGNITQIDIGCDVARFGDDKTCIGYRINEVIKIYKKYNGKDTTWTASNIANLGLKLVEKYNFKNRIPVKVDDGGVGGGVVDQLRALKRTYPDKYWWLEVVPVNFGQPIKHKYYYDTTTYMMGIVRDLIIPFDNEGNEKKPEIILPNDNDLVGQLSCRKYSFMSNSKQKVESKKEMKARGLASPDEADCILLVCLPVKLRKSKGKE